MTTVLRPGPRTRFTLPASASATEPPEARGLRRDAVRLLVAHGESTWSSHFRDLPGFLRPGDLLVVNTSRTLAAAVDGTRATGDAVVVHFSTWLDDGTWIVELRRPDQTGPVRDGRPGETVRLAGGAALTLQAGYPPGGRLWRARLAGGTGVAAYLFDHGRPIRYGYVPRRWPLRDYQTVFGTEPGSAEMPSAGRPFTPELVTELVAAGVGVAPVTLHCGVSSLESHEPPAPERFRVPAPTARLVNLTRAHGGRVVAVGTTVARALETVADRAGVVSGGSGWTDLVLGPDRPARAVTGLITGFHPPEASHLLLLEAIADPAVVQRVYDQALAGGYRWHEFGDSALLY